MRRRSRSSICAGSSGRGSRPWRPSRPSVALLDEADLTARLEHGQLDVVERLDLLQARLGAYLVEAEPLAPQVRLDRLPGVHDHDRLAVEQRARPGKAPAHVRED